MFCWVITLSSFLNAEMPPLLTGALTIVSIYRALVVCVLPGTCGFSTLTKWKLQCPKEGDVNQLKLSFSSPHRLRSCGPTPIMSMMHSEGACDSPRWATTRIRRSPLIIFCTTERWPKQWHPTYSFWIVVAPDQVREEHDSGVEAGIYFERTPSGLLSAHSSCNVRTQTEECSDSEMLKDNRID